MRLIDADELLKKHKFDITNWNKPYGVLNENIAKAPTVDPVKHGRWFREPGTIAIDVETCSVCGAMMNERNQFWNSNYCPCCGAKMDL